MAHQIERRDNFFSVDLKEGDEVQMGVNGEIVITLVIPYGSKLNCYLKSDKPPITYK